MAKLPTSLDMPAPNGAVSRGPAVDFGSLDNALQGVAKNLERWDGQRREADDQEAVRAVEDARQTWALSAGERAALYDGREPGYAERELKAFDDAFAATQAREDLPDGVRMAVGRRVRDLRVQTGASLVATEANARGQRAAGDRDAAEQSQAINALMGVQKAFDDAEDARKTAWNGVDPGYAEGLMDDWRLLSSTAVEGLPERVQERLKPMLLSAEVNLQARSMAAEDESRDARTLTTVADGMKTLINRAGRDPSLMSRFDAEAAPILEAAPASLRARLLTEAKNDAQTLALETRIQDGQFDAVKSEIEAGRYDSLDAGRLGRLKDMVKSAEENGVITDTQRAADLDAKVTSDLRTILSGGQADPALIAEARLIGGEPMATKVRIDQQAALDVRPLMARLRTMTPDQAAAELDRRTQGADTAVEARSLELARSMIEQDRGLRADPARWAATPVGPGDAVAQSVQARLRAFGDTPTPETAQAYARATLIAQGAGGVLDPQRRILSEGQAEAWVARIGAGQGGEGLAALAAKLSLFGPEHQPRLTREMIGGGLKPADLGALTYYARSPVALEAYAANRGRALNEVVTEKNQRDRINADLDRALRPFADALATGPGARAAYEAAKVSAYGAVASGQSVRDAVEAATRPMVDGWTFMGSWAVPKTAGVEPDLARRGAGEILSDLTRDRGAGLFAPTSSRMTPEQARANYADIVRNTGQWRNLGDGSGVELVTPANDATGVMAVRDAQGQPVRRTWRQLDAARRRGPSGSFGFN